MMSSHDLRSVWRRLGAWTRAPLRLAGVPCWFALAAGLALVLRGLLWRQYLGSPFARSPVGDEYNYWVWARGIASGAWLPSGVFYQGPLYPYFLGGLKAAFPSFGQAHLAALQLLLNWVTCLFFLPLFRRWVGERVALVASALGFFFGPAVFFSLKGVPTTLGFLLLVLGLLVLSAGPKKRVLKGILSGLLLGLAVLAVPSFALVPAAAALFLVLRPHGGRSLLPAASLLAAAFLAIFPAGISNYLQDGSFVPLSSNFGAAFAQGNNPRATGGYSRIEGLSLLVTDERQDAALLARRETDRPLNQAEVGLFFLMKGFRFIAGEPGRWMLLEARKAVLLAGGFDVPLEFSQARERRDFLPLLWFFPVGGTASLLLASLALADREARGRLLLPLLAALALAAPCLVFFTANRFAVPVHFLLLPAGAGGLLALPGLRRRPLRAAALLPVALSAALAAPALASPAWETEGYLPKLVIAYEETGDLPMVAKTFRRWMDLSPHSSGLYWLMAVVYSRNGDPAFALAAVDRSLSLDPGNRDSRFLQASLLWGTGRREEALEALSRLLEEAPGDTASRLRRIEYLRVLGRTANLEDEWRTAMTLDPFSPVLLLAHGSYLLERGRIAEAREEFARARALDPSLRLPPLPPGEGAGPDPGP